MHVLAQIFTAEYWQSKPAVLSGTQAQQPTFLESIRDHFYGPPKPVGPSKEQIKKANEKIIDGARYDSPKKITLALKMGAEIDLENFNGWSALGKASERGHISAMETLLNAGAKIKAHDVYIAAFYGHTKATRILLKAGGPPGAAYRGAMYYKRGDQYVRGKSRYKGLARMAIRYGYKMSSYDKSNFFKLALYQNGITR